jgi:hypothetical protein
MSYSLEGHNEFPSKIVYLDSRDASIYLATNSNGDNLSSYFQYQLTEQIVIPDEMNCLISLNGATIPYSFYNIREGVNDKIDFLVCRKWNSKYWNCDFKIPAGNYSAISLGNYLEDHIPDQVFTGTTYSFTFTMQIINQIVKSINLILLVLVLML